VVRNEGAEEQLRPWPRKACRLQEEQGRTKLHSRCSWSCIVCVRQLMQSVSFSLRASTIKRSGWDWLGRAFHPRRTRRKRQRLVTEGHARETARERTHLALLGTPFHDAGLVSPFAGPARLLIPRSSAPERPGPKFWGRADVFLATVAQQKHWFPICRGGSGVWGWREARGRMLR